MFGSYWSWIHTYIEEFFLTDDVFEVSSVFFLWISSVKEQQSLVIKHKKDKFKQ